LAETIIALFLAHVLADYVLQTRWMVDTKRGAGFAVHIATVLVTSMLCLGQLTLAVIAITFIHLLIDATKTMLLPDRLWSYLADQGLHLLSIAAIAALFPGAWQAGLWAGMAPAGAPAVMAVIAGLIFATRAGHFAIATYIASPHDGEQRGRARRAALTGGLERGAVFAAVLCGVASLALVVLAAKAGIWWVRGGAEAAGRDRAIAATLASFAWALVVAYATRALIAMP
jgi:hypothetical protein